MAAYNDEHEMKFLSTDNPEFLMNNNDSCICTVSPPAPPSTPNMLVPTNISNAISTNSNFDNIFTKFGIDNSNSPSASSNMLNHVEQHVTNIPQHLDISKFCTNTNYEDVHDTDAELSNMFKNISTNDVIAKPFGNTDHTTSLTEAHEKQQHEDDVHVQ